MILFSKFQKVIRESRYLGNIRSITELEIGGGVCMRNKKISFIDLFAGTGGFSEGFVVAGYTPLVHVEMNAAACDTLRTRACYHYLRKKGQP